jgi:hypothetical protein
VYGICMPLMKIGRSVILLFVKLICTDLDSLSLIRHFLVQILSKADCNLMVELSAVSPTAITAVSSANVAVVLYCVVGKSLM